MREAIDYSRSPKYIEEYLQRKYAKDNGFKNTRVFVDDGWSGTTFARPAFTEIMELAEKGMIGTLIVKDHSRLGRNRLVVGQLLEEGFDSLGVRYIDGKRVQLIDIYYNGVGILRELTPEEMEESFQKHMAERKAKTA